MKKFNWSYLQYHTIVLIIVINQFKSYKFWPWYYQYNDETIIPTFWQICGNLISFELDPFSLHLKLIFHAEVISYSTIERSSDIHRTIHFANTFGFRLFPNVLIYMQENSFQKRQKGSVNISANFVASFVISVMLNF